MTKTQKALIVTVVSAIMLHINYQSGFVPEKDIVTLIGIIAAIAGVEVPEVFAKKKAETTNEGS